LARTVLLMTESSTYSPAVSPLQAVSATGLARRPTTTSALKRRDALILVFLCFSYAVSQATGAATVIR